MNPSSFSAMVAVLGCPQLFVNLDVCSQQNDVPDTGVPNDASGLQASTFIFRLPDLTEWLRGAVLIVAGTVPPIVGASLGGPPAGTLQAALPGATQSK
jgi:hypothetical protein